MSFQRSLKKLPVTLSHFRIDTLTHNRLKRISKEYNVKMTELCRMAVEQLVLTEWPRVRG